MSADVGGPCLTPWLMAIGHRLSHLYFFCSLALSFQVSHWSGALRHRIIYCCQESWGQREREGGRERGGLQKEQSAAERRQLRGWGEAGTLDCQISTVEYLMEPGVFI